MRLKAKEPRYLSVCTAKKDAKTNTLQSEVTIAEQGAIAADEGLRLVSHRADRPLYS